MKTETIHARVDPKVKKASEKILKQTGLTMSEAISLFLKQMVNRQQFPLELKIPNKVTIRAIKDSYDPKNLTSYSSVEELLKTLNGRYEENNKRKKIRKGLRVNEKTRQKTGKTRSSNRIAKTRNSSSRFVPAS